MSNELPTTMRQLRSLVTDDGRLELSIASIDVPVPLPHEVLVRIEAAPINPSDLGLLLAMADLDTATASGTADDPVVTATDPPQPRARACCAHRPVDAGRQRRCRHRGRRGQSRRGPGVDRQAGGDRRRCHLRGVPRACRR